MSSRDPALKDLFLGGGAKNRGAPQKNKGPQELAPLPNAKVNEEITGASQSSSRAALKGVCSTATIRPVIMHLVILIVARGPITCM